MRIAILDDEPFFRHLLARSLCGAADIRQVDEYGTAAELVDARAMHHLGRLAQQAGDMELAESWWQKSAAGGEPWAMYELGVLAKAAGDVAAARTWWEQAAELDDSQAMYDLGVLAREAGDMELAESWWRKAAELGSPEALDALGQAG